MAGFVSAVIDRSRDPLLIAQIGLHVDIFCYFCYSLHISMINLTYRTIIEPDEKGFHGYVPALRGCHTWGKTIQETQNYLHEAIELYLESLVSHGEVIPHDQSFESYA